LQAVVKSAAGDIILMYEIEPGFKKKPGFFKKPNPVGFFGFYWELDFIGFFAGIFYVSGDCYFT